MVKKKDILLIITILLNLFCNSGWASLKDSYRTINEEWLGIYFKGSKLGFLHSHITESDKGYLIKIVSLIKTEGFGAEQIISFRQESTMSKNLRTTGFILMQKINEKEQKIIGKVEGDKMIIETISPGNIFKKTIGFPENTYLASDVMLMIVKKGLKEGKNYSVNILIESLQSTVPLEVRVSGKEKIEIKGKKEDTFVIEETIKGMTSKLWVRPNGDTVKQVSFEGFEIIREDERTAIEFKKGNIPTTSLINLSLIKAESDIKNAREVEKMKVMVAMSKAASIIEDQRQNITGRISGQEVEVTVLKEDIDEQVKKIVMRQIKKPSLMPFLAENQIIQPHNKDIKKRAREIVGEEIYVWAAVQRLNRWVYNYMKKSPVDTFSSVDALMTGKGECQSHTNLFTALARSVGIPAKVVSGLVYSPYYKGFIYHSWPEVYTDRWIAIDPTLGEDVADATHIKLSEGEEGNQLDILKFLGKTGIEIKGFKKSSSLK